MKTGACLSKTLPHQTIIFKLTKMLQTMKHLRRVKTIFPLLMLIILAMEKTAVMLVIAGVKLMNALQGLQIHFAGARCCTRRGKRTFMNIHGKDFEYLSFPTIFCGKRRPDNNARKIPVSYSTVATCKWELRYQD